MNTIEMIRERRIIVVYRGLSGADCVEASKALMDGGISLFEVTMNSPDPAASIRLLRKELGTDAAIGAGTVTSVAQVDLAADAGATYIISPNTNRALIQRTNELGLISIPGAFSPTEVIEARDAGADMIKVFPIKTVGADYLRQLSGPIDDVDFVATGGVTLSMIPSLFEAGTTAVALGLHLIREGVMASKDWSSLRHRAEAFLEAANVDT